MFTDILQTSTLIFKFLVIGFCCNYAYVYAEGTDPYQTIFCSIYNNALWGRNDQGEGHSGGGATVNSTRIYTDFLKKFIATHEVNSIIDTGCGDWEFSQYIDWGTIQYTGYDVVEHVIQKNNARYTTSNIHFVHANFLKENLPPADLLLCKHVLQHMPNKDIIFFLKQLSKFKYCLITNEIDPKTLSSDNNDIAIGATHTIDVSRPPFNLIGTKVLQYQLGHTIHQVFFIDNTIGKEK
jgi:SAM-dependent methyltransferase